MKLSNTYGIYMEINARCQLSGMHVKCPLHLHESDDELPTEIVHGVMDYCSENKWEGTIKFHNYNEPLTDKRLPSFIKYASDRNLKTEVTTNGVALDQDMMNCLCESGTTNIRVSVYSGSEKNRIKELKTTIPIVYSDQTRMDDRLDVYDRKPGNFSGKCGAPFSDIIIRVDGTIGLCCIDWRNTRTFGNLKNNTMEEILSGEEINQVHTELSKGIRTTELCKRCPGGR